MIGRITCALTLAHRLWAGLAVPRRSVIENQNNEMDTMDRKNIAKKDKTGGAGTHVGKSDNSHSAVAKHVDIPPGNHHRPRTGHFSSDAWAATMCQLMEQMLFSPLDQQVTNQRHGTVIVNRVRYKHKHVHTGNCVPYLGATTDAASGTVLPALDGALFA
eukprot:SAG31_NODE_1547_length_7925_cov_3.563251_11_plen_160_part_00